jgi:hypothetical protein
LLPGNQIREREAGKTKGFYILGEIRKKVPLSGARISGTEHVFWGADSDGMMEGIPLSFFWNSLACIF